MENTFKGKGVIKWALSIGIIVVLNLFFAVAIETVYPAPEFNDFCTQEQVTEEYGNEDSCVAAGGQWNETIAKPETSGSNRNVVSGWCNANFTCAMEYQEASKDYARNVFVTLVVLGALSMIAGYVLRISPAVSAGLSYGGVLSFIIAAMRYWGEAGDIVRLVIVGIALLALIVIGVKKFKE